MTQSIFENTEFIVIKKACVCNFARRSINFLFNTIGISSWRVNPQGLLKKQILKINTYTQCTFCLNFKT